MHKTWRTKLGAVGVCALALTLAVSTSPALAVGSGSEPVPPAGLTGLEPTGADMPTVGGNLGNQHYSGLTQIAKDNLDQLAPAWRTHVSAVAPATDDTGQQTTPIVVEGVIYMDTPSGGVIAVDGASGAPAWKWEGGAYGLSGTRRGVSAGDGKIFTLAGGNRVVALDQATGAEVWAVQPTGPEGEDVGRVGKVATVYYNGMVFAHAADGDRGAVVALDADDGSYLWHFFGGPQRGETFTGLDGVTFDASETWGPVLPDGTDCAQEGGATSWMHGAVDPELNVYYMTFGNPRSCNTSQDGSQRPGDNLFSTTMVAVDAGTGEYKWHYQSIRHDIWDMDNVHPPTLADIEVDGVERKVVFYGSKSGHQFVLDRTNGQPVLPVIQKPMITDSRQSQPDTQPFPASRLLPECVVWEKLGTDNIPGDPWRAVPNYNGYQPDAEGNLVFNPDSYVAADEPYLTYPEGSSGHREGCMYDPQWDAPILSTTSQNGGGDWSSQSYSHSTNLVYFPYGTNPVAHYNGASANGLRAIGQYQTGGILAYDASTGEVAWTNHLGTDMSHGQSPLTTASDLLVVGQIDGRALIMDATTGDVLWEFQTGSGIAAAPVTYEVDGEQYIAVFAAGSTNPYGGSVTQGDSLWAFKLGGSYTADSGSQEGPDTAPLTIRRPVGGSAVAGETVANTVLLARTSRTDDTAAAQDSVATGAMQPTHLRVPVGTTVTFRNPGVETFPNFPNLKPHCATQFFEGEFNARLQPGETYEHTFDRAGEYFFNDCTDPRPTGKIEVYLEPQAQPAALTFTPDRLSLGSPSGLFTDVRGTVSARFDLPAGHAYDSGAVVVAPLSVSPIPASNVTAEGDHLILEFDAAALDHNVPVGETDLTVRLNTIDASGVQRQLTSTATVTVSKDTLHVTTTPRSLAGKVYLSVSALNDATVPVDIVISSPFGDKTFTDVAPGRTVSVSLNTRGASITAGEVTVTATASIDGRTLTRTKTAGFEAFPAG
ncbi:outer membrane protein assembly factor BamB family protein [Microbacterium jiangjiandongii]|uniref:outer membrane protein assembly factor BamB family protein n=1 Tax=Microbacterium jiangjiandongii TaxID=3049071 RepID=UPI00214CCAAC|nr:PQQ-binding-like beta-propeller repeat protein [Microbacterium sp. zg.Y843]MCR2816655.1 PQQ-binding-like beta-propeller repeat protein [Microbacterium sp. zg.Y843]